MRGERSSPLGCVVNTLAKHINARGEISASKTYDVVLIHLFVSSNNMSNKTYNFLSCVLFPFLSVLF